MIILKYIGAVIVVGVHLWVLFKMRTLRKYPFLVGFQVLFSLIVVLVALAASLYLLFDTK